MKKLKFILIAVILISCSKKENVEPQIIEKDLQEEPDQTDLVVSDDYGVSYSQSGTSCNCTSCSDCINALGGAIKDNLPKIEYIPICSLPL